MACESNRSCRKSSGLPDRISKLPDEIREYILGYLPISDAIRTSVLSRKWRYSWTKMVQLNLYFNEDEDMENGTRDRRYFRLVGRILLSHAGPVHKCVFYPKCVNLKEHTDLRGDMNAWLLSLSRKGVKDLTIYCHEEMDIFELPTSIFQCLELSRLTLGKCVLENSIAFKGFPHLARLDLCYVDIMDNMLEKITSSCPLEMLYIGFCNFYGMDWPCKDAICAPNLRVLEIVCCNHGLDNCYLQYTPNVRVASFRMECGSRIPNNRKSNCYYILRSMPKIEELTFDCRLHKTSASDIIPNKLPELLKNLKTVNLCYMDALSMDQMSFMFCIIQNTPNCQNLKIHLSGMDGKLLLSDKDNWEAVIQYLEVVAKEEIKTSITDVSVTFGKVDNAEHIGADIALIDIIVSCCPVLGILAITTSSSLKGSLKLQLSAAFRRYGKLSSKPKIVYSRF